MSTDETVSASERQTDEQSKRAPGYRCIRCGEYLPGVDPAPVSVTIEPTESNSPFAGGAAFLGTVRVDLCWLCSESLDDFFGENPGRIRPYRGEGE